jgi:uncharacterized protein YukE
MAFVGMVIEEVEQLAAQMDQHASDIMNIVARLTSTLEGAHWVGTDREGFVSQWQGSHVPALNNVANGLNDAANKARQNAQQQQQASAT